MPMVRLSSLDKRHHWVGSVRRHVAAAWGLFFGFLAFATHPALAQSFELTNPLILQRADPDIYLHTDGYYYFTATVPEYNRIELRRASAIQDLSTATPTVIWSAHPSGEMATHIWAPEIHYIDGSWYVYFAAGSSSNVWDIRVYVLSNDTANPLAETWTELGQLVTNGPKASGAFFALDATTFQHLGVQYLVWAEADPSLNVNTVLYIAPMSNPWTLSASGVRISAPEYDWETRGYAVNEGPAVLKRNGKIFISYSASATNANYCMGLLTADDTSDLLDPESWSKATQPVLRSGNGVYGPGHNQFTTSPDGSVDLLVYHARDFEQIVGDPLDDPNRATRVQPLAWNDDGTPQFGEFPLADGALTVEVETGTAGAAGTSGTAGAPDGAGAAGTTEQGGRGGNGLEGDGGLTTAGEGGKDMSQGGSGGSPMSRGGASMTASGGNAGSPMSIGGASTNNGGGSAGSPMSTTSGGLGPGAAGGASSGARPHDDTGGAESGGRLVSGGNGGTEPTSSGGAVATGGITLGGTTTQSMGGEGYLPGVGGGGQNSDGGLPTTGGSISTSSPGDPGCGCRAGTRPVSGGLWALVLWCGIGLRRRRFARFRASRVLEGESDLGHYSGSVVGTSRRPSRGNCSWLHSRSV